MTSDKDPDKPFDPPVAVRIGEALRDIGSVREAIGLLSSTDWPGMRGPRHRDAVETCLKVVNGHRSTVDARRSFIEAAREAGLLAAKDVRSR